MHNTNALQHVKALASRLCHSSGPPLSAQHQGGVTCAHHQHWETVPCRWQDAGRACTCMQYQAYCMHCHAYRMSLYNLHYPIYSMT